MYRHINDHNILVLDIRRKYIIAIMFHKILLLLHLEQVHCAIMKWEILYITLYELQKVLPFSMLVIVVKNKITTYSLIKCFDIKDV